MKKNAEPTDEEEGDEPPAKTEKAKKAAKGHDDAPPVFVKLRPFTVKLQSEGQEAYLQAHSPSCGCKMLTSATRSNNTHRKSGTDLCCSSFPARRRRIEHAAGVQKLSNEMRVTINAIIEPPPMRKKGGTRPTRSPAIFAGPDDPVQAVLFTSFIVQ